MKLVILNLEIQQHDHCKNWIYKIINFSIMNIKFVLHLFQCFLKILFSCHSFLFQLLDWILQMIKKMIKHIQNLMNIRFMSIRYHYDQAIKEIEQLDEIFNMSLFFSTQLKISKIIWFPLMNKHSDCRFQLLSLNNYNICWISSSAAIQLKMNNIQSIWK